jgi:hypothetical protein
LFRVGVEDFWGDGFWMMGLFVGDFVLGVNGVGRVWSFGKGLGLIWIDFFLMKRYRLYD